VAPRATGPWTSRGLNLAGGHVRTAGAP
jgi:hypothetical protein